MAEPEAVPDAAAAAPAEAEAEAEADPTFMTGGDESASAAPSPEFADEEPSAEAAAAEAELAAMGDSLMEMDEQLKGVTVLPKPHVSKEVMVKVLQEHNGLMVSVKKDITTTNREIGKLAKKADVIEGDLGEVTERVDAAETNIAGLGARVRTLEKRTDEIAEQLTAIDELRALIAAQDARIKLLETAVPEVRETVAAHAKAEKERLDGHDVALAKQLEQHERLEVRVTRMPGELRLPTDQIVVRDPALTGGNGDEDDESTLTGLLRTDHAALLKAGASISVHGKMIKLVQVRSLSFSLSRICSFFRSSPRSTLVAYVVESSDQIGLERRRARERRVKRRIRDDTRPHHGLGTS